jgi:hypothetical protein
MLMKKPAIILSSLAVATVCLLSATGARAQTITANYTTPNNQGQNVRYSLSTNTGNDSPNTTYETSNAQTWAGRFVWNQTTPLNTNYWATFDTYCVELTQTAASPTTFIVDSTVNLISPAVGGKIAWLYNTYATQSISAINAAALQIAIWEIRYDGGSIDIGANGGKFFVNTGFANDTAVIAQANTYLTSIGNNTSTAAWLRNSQRQDQVGPRPPLEGQGNNRVPEPGAFALLAAGLPLVALLRRRK